MTAAAVIAAILTTVIIWIAVTEHINDRRPHIHPSRLTRTGTTTAAWAAHTATGYTLHPRPLDRTQRNLMADLNTDTTSFDEWDTAWRSDPRPLTQQIVDRVTDQTRTVFEDTLDHLSRTTP